MFVFLALADARKHRIPSPRPIPVHRKTPRPKPIQNEFEDEEKRVVLRKPAIYLYPAQETDLNVTVKLNRKRFTALVPEFDFNTTWSVKAKTTGELVHQGKNIPYLFWEGLSKFKPNFNQGFKVKKGEAKKFLEEKLTALNLNDREKFDFMAYWIPVFNSMGNVFCSFQFKNYQKAAPLAFSTKPDTLIRVFIAIRKAGKADKKRPQQKLPHVERKGFTVVEWGGMVDGQMNNNMTMFK